MGRHFWLCTLPIPGAVAVAALGAPFYPAVVPAAAVQSSLSSMEMSTSSGRVFESSEMTIHGPDGSACTLHFEGRADFKVSMTVNPSKCRVIQVSQEDFK